ncbi:hypothetical protein [Micromonospora sp. 067-2]|uniref:hypothetical protein n=1 Tax=Micromonospora sp. 067-2 TaxID=2789270 RepID=UPI00397D957E
MAVRDGGRRGVDRRKLLGLAGGVLAGVVLLEQAPASAAPRQRIECLADLKAA